MRTVYSVAVLCGAVSLKAFCAQAQSQVAGVPFDLQGFIDREIAAGNRRIVVPSGRYRVTPTGGNGKMAPAGAHKNIRILANTIAGCSLPGIYVASTDGLRIENNTFPSPRADGISKSAPAGPEPVETANCTGITMKDNVVPQ